MIHKNFYALCNDQHLDHYQDMIIDGPWTKRQKIAINWLRVRRATVKSLEQSRERRSFNLNYALDAFNLVWRKAQSAA
jgi:hypothetical protein